MEQGRFVWHDLMTSDPDAAQRFYVELFGWKIEEVDMGPMGKYPMLVAGESRVGGIVPLDPKHGAPPHWLGYVSVDDVDAAAKRAEQMGGKVAVPATDIPNVGRFAVVIDPKGAAVAPFKGVDDMPEVDGPPAAGTFAWDELMTDDLEAAKRFYGELFGWTTEEMDMGPMGTYVVFKGATRERAGCMKPPPPPQGPPCAFWLTYITVQDVDASAKKATELGATQNVPPTDVPKVCRFAVFTDPQGASFALFRPAAD